MKEGARTSFIVYKHTSPSGKVYIGITGRSSSERFGHNGSNYKENEHFWHAIKKYGWNNFKHEILYSGLSKENACKTEIELIAKYNSANQEYGYNISLGGEHSAPSEETRKKMSEAKKNMSEETRRKISEGAKGHAVSKETLKKMAEGRKNVSEERRREWSRKLSEANKRRATRGVSEETRRKISEANKGKNHGRKGIPLSKETREKIREKEPKRPVMCVETEVVYTSVRDAQRKTGINCSTISLVCNGHRKTAGGFHWRFITQEEESSEVTTC